MAVLALPIHITGGAALVYARFTMRLALSSFVVVVALGCSPPPASPDPADSASARATTPSAPASSAAAPVTVPTQTADSAPPTDGGPTLDASAAPEPPPPPAPVQRTGKTWPFHAWDRAEAVTFNQFSMRPGVPLYAYNDRGWSEHIVDRKPLDAPRAKKAVDYVSQTNGSVDVSKCPFPRHAVVLYEGDVPVASINICFECGDILIWPPWDRIKKPEPNYDKFTDKDWKKMELENERKMKLYEKVFPKWQVFFRDEVGFPIDAKHR